MTQEVPGPRGRENIDPTDRERFEKYRDEMKKSEREIKAQSALSRELWEHFVTSRSVSKMVTDMGGLDEIERVYGKKDRDELEKMIFEETEANLKEGEK